MFSAGSVDGIYATAATVWGNSFTKSKTDRHSWCMFAVERYKLQREMWPAGSAVEYQAFVYIRVSESATRKMYETGGGDLRALSVSAGITDRNVKHTNAHLCTHTHTFVQPSLSGHCFDSPQP